MKETLHTIKEWIDRHETELTFATTLFTGACAGYLMGTAIFTIGRRHGASLANNRFHNYLIKRAAMESGLTVESLLITTKWPIK